MNTVDIFIKPVVLRDSWDRYGHSFKELTDIQSDQLHRWGTRLITRVTYEVWAYLKSTNLPATDEKQVHRVYRGQDLVQIIMDWPDLKPCYVQPSKPEDPRADI